MSAYPDRHPYVDANHPFWVRAFWVLFALTAVLMYVRLGDYPLQMQWEPNYGMVLQEMLLGEGDWITPSSRVGGDEGATPGWFFSKPVGIFWFAAPFFALFSDIAGREWATRLGNATVGLLGVWYVFFLMRRLFDTRTGFFAALVTATVPVYVIISRAFMVDILFVNFWMFAWGFYLLGEREGKARWYDLFYVCLGVSAWAKGITPLLLTTIVFVVYWSLDLDWNRVFRLRSLLGLLAALAGVLVFTVVLAAIGPLQPAWLGGARWLSDLFMFKLVGDDTAAFARSLQFLALIGAIVWAFGVGAWVFAHELKRMRIVRGLLIFAAVGASWYVYMTARFGWHYVDNFLIGHHVRRVEGRLDKPNETFEWFMLYFLLGVIPWVGFLPVAFASAIQWLRRSTARQPLLFFVVGFVVCFTFFSSINTKFAHYIFPVVPFATLLIGAYLSRAVDARGEHLSRIAAGVSLLVFAIVAPDLLDQKNYRILFYFMTTERLQDWHGNVGDPGPFLKYVYPLWALTMVLMFLGYRWWRHLTFVLGGLAFAIVFFIGTIMIPELCWMFSSKLIMQEYLSRAKPGEPVAEFTQTWKSRSIKYEMPFGDLKDKYRYHNYRIQNNVASVKRFIGEYGRNADGTPKRVFIIIEQKQRHFGRIQQLWQQATNGETLVKLADDTYPRTVAPGKEAFQYQPEFWLVSNYDDAGALQKSGTGAQAEALAKFVLPQCPTIPVPLEARFGTDRAIQLKGYEIVREDATGRRTPVPIANPESDRPAFPSGEKLVLRTFWGVSQPVQREPEIFIHLETGANFRLRGDHGPVDNTYDVSQWKPGECVIDEFAVEIPKGHEGDLEVLIGMFKDDFREPIDDRPYRTADNRLRLATLSVTR